MLLHTGSRPLGGFLAFVGLLAGLAGCTAGGTDAHPSPDATAAYAPRILTCEEGTPEEYQWLRKVGRPTRVMQVDLGEGSWPGEHWWVVGSIDGRPGLWVTNAPSPVKRDRERWNSGTMTNTEPNQVWSMPFGTEFPWVYAAADLVLSCLARGTLTSVIWKP